MVVVEKKESNMWFVIKAFAILSVVAAHMSFPLEYFVSDTIRNCLGQIGVGIFFISAGYFYNRKPNDSKIFWQKKIKTVFLPWLIFSTVVFILSEFIFGVPENLVFDFIKNFFGVGTIYWYMTVLLVLLIIFKYIYKTDIILYLCIAITFISVSLSSMDLIPYTTVFNKFFNIFNWIGFFALGILLRRKELVDKLLGLKFTIISLIGLIVATIIAVMKKELIQSYIDSTSLFVELFGLILLLNIADFLTSSKLLIDIGKKSFFIYLIHIQIVGIINTRLPYNALFFILRPIIGLAVCYIVAIVFKYVLNKIKLSKYSFVFGLDR